MGSILEEYKLDVETFEAVISRGATKPQVMTIFNVSGSELDEWCKKNYKGRNFMFVYDYVRQCCLDKYLQVVQSLGYRGNPSALGIINQSIQKLSENQTVKIVFGNDIPKEDEKDKEDDE